MVLWLYLFGEQVQATLSANTEAIAAGSWPDALIEVYRDKRLPASALEAAVHVRKDIKRRRLTQAHFDLGALAQLQGDEIRARQHYQAAIAFGVFGTIEHAAARIRLQKLRH